MEKAAQFSNHQIFQSGITFSFAILPITAYELSTYTFCLQEKKKGGLSDSCKEFCDSHAETDDTRQTEKTARVSTLTLLSLTQSADALGRPFAICVGRKLLNQYPDLYVTDTQHNRVFRIGDVSNASNDTLRGCLTAMPLPRGYSTQFLSTAMNYMNMKVFVVNSYPSKQEVLQCHTVNEAVQRLFTSDHFLSLSAVCFSKCVKCLS